MTITIPVEVNTGLKLQALREETEPAVIVTELLESYLAQVAA